MTKKILMVLMGLDIGGAETHVVELSKELKKRGNEILVVSNGGVYEKELTDAGIRCFHAPLHKRNVLLMLRSLSLLNKIIKTEKPDIVHAHARIPAFLCGFLHKKYGFTFVTSAHWVFYVSPLLKKICNWGQSTVAVSEDIREYLRENYRIPEDNVIVTVNGVDTGKFSASTSAEKIFKEFDIDPEKPVISYVSRLDSSRSLVARHLVQAAPKLKKEYPDLQIMITGGGDDFENIKKMVFLENSAKGEDYIKLTGPRSDINEIVAACDVFVGVSRSALEAMASEKPVIVAGNEGYIGLFDESKLEISRETNFCARGCGESSPELLLEDLRKALAMPEDERRSLGKFGRSVIQCYYSVSKMTDDCERCYKKAGKGPKVVVSGYYGANNLGDDSILLSLRDRLQKINPNTRITVLSNKPDETIEKCRIGAVYRYDIFKVAKAIKDCDVFISGGGSLLQDNTSTRSLLYYSGLSRYAKHKGKKLIIYANGIGPVNHHINQIRVRKTLDAADAVTLRDYASLSEAVSYGVKNGNMFLSADAVYGTAAGNKAEGLKYLSENLIPCSRSLIGISVRFAKNMTTNVAEFARFCDRLSEKYNVVFIVMQYPGDLTTAKEIQKLMTQPSWRIACPYEPQKMMSVISCMDMVVSTRLHSIIYASCVNVPVLGIVYDPKVEACLKSIGMPSAGTLDGFNADEALESVENVALKRDDFKKILAENCEKLRKLEEVNFKVLKETFEK